MQRTRGEALSARLMRLFCWVLCHILFCVGFSNQRLTQEISVPSLERGLGQAQEHVNVPLGDVSTVETPTNCPSTTKRT